MDGHDRDVSDLELLLKQVERVKALLTWLVFESADLAELRREFEGAFRETRERIERLEVHLAQLKPQLRSKSREEAAGELRSLREAGLAGEQLYLKDRIFDWLLNCGTRRVKWLLGWANSLLGSLVNVYGWLEPVREYKEGVELIVTKRRWPSEPPTAIFPK